MLAKPEDAEELNSTIEQMLQLGKLGSFDFDHNFQEIYSEPGTISFSMSFYCIDRLYYRRKFNSFRRERCITRS